MQSAINNRFQQVFQQAPQIVIRSPGRINLIGEHTDYNDGFVLPAAIDRSIWFAASRRDDDQCHWFAYDMDESVQISLKQLKFSDQHPWSNYLLGVVDEIQKLGKKFGGLNVVFGGNLPSGAGLSSSAAIENGIGFAINELYDLGLSRLDLVHISKRAENNFVGMNCGIMDMFTSMMAQKNQVILLDCQSLEHSYFPFDAPDIQIVLCDTGVKHKLIDSEFNTRRLECQEGVNRLQRIDPSIHSLRDVSNGFLTTHKTVLRPVVYRRCKYVIEEIARVKKACLALKASDYQAFGQLMFDTHTGLDQEYEVSCPEANFLVEQARKQDACLGARMMGGGFGGCTINLVKLEKVDSFIDHLRINYQKKYNRDMLTYQVQLCSGLQLENALHQ